MSDPQILAGSQPPTLAIAALPPPRRPRWVVGLALAAAVLLLIIGGLWFVQTRRLRQQLAQTQAERSAGDGHSVEH